MVLRGVDKEEHKFGLVAPPLETSLDFLMNIDGLAKSLGGAAKDGVSRGKKL